MNKLKMALFAFFFLFGIVCAYLTFNLSNKDSFGKTDFTSPRYSEPIAGAGTGVDSSNDGVAVGLGLISGFSLLSSVLLLNNINKQ